MTLPCPNCGAWLRLIVDDPGLQAFHDAQEQSVHARLVGIEDAMDILKVPKRWRERLVENSPSCPACHGLLHPIQAPGTQSLWRKAGRDVEAALVLAPDAQPEREGVV